MKRIVLFFLSFLTLWLGGANPAWAQEDSGGESGSTTTTSGFWDQSGYWAESLSVNETTKTIEISSAEEFARFANAGSAISNEGWSTGYVGWTINLTQNIDLSGHYWKPIAFSTAFRGTFNGNGHTIKGVYLDAKTITTDNKGSATTDGDPARMTRNGFGLFAEVEGTVQDLTIDNSSFYLKETRVSTKGNYLGAICGKLNNGGVLRNCKVINTTVEGLDYIGGLAGLVSSDNDAPTTIVGCNSAAEVEGRSYVGGIAGEVRGNASVRYSLYTFTSNTTLATPSVYASSSAAGYIIGNNRSTATGENKVEKNYFIDQDFTPLNADDHRVRSVFYKVSNNGENTTPWLELDFGPSINYSNSGIIAYENILYYSNKYYAADGEKVIFGLKINDTSKGTYIDNVRVNDDLARKESVGKYSFAMTDHSAEVTAALLAANSWDQEGIRATKFSNFDKRNKEILITSAAELGLLADSVNNGNTYEGWTIKLSNESTSDFDTDGNLLMSGHGWVPIGSLAHPFKGTFDGQGLGIRSLISADSRIAADQMGLFGCVSGGTVKSVKIYNSIFQGMNHVAAIVGRLDGGATITDCLVDESCNIVGSGDYVGGIAGLADYRTTVSGSVSAAPVTGVKRVGGLVGQTNGDAKLLDNMYTGEKGYVTASGVEGNGWVSYLIGNINTTRADIVRTFTMASRVETQINNYDHLAYAVSSSDNVTLTFDGAAQSAAYTTSGITAYTTTSSTSSPSYLTLGGKSYFEINTTLGVTLNVTSGSETVTIKNVTVNSGTLSVVEEATNKYSLALNSGDNQTDVVIVAITEGKYWTDYAAESFATQDETNKTITISTPEQLALLAKKVNSGTSYEDYTITLTGSISLEHPASDASVSPEWMPIGNFSHYFLGTFDGAGYTISKLKVDGDSYAGLFGYTGDNSDGKAAKIQHVKLDNSTIDGFFSVGGIVGQAEDKVQVEDCVVTSSTTVKGASSVGGIVGRTYGGTVKGCVSAATVTGLTSNTGRNIGGIVGDHIDGLVQHCVYNGTSVTGGSSVAACIGHIVKFNVDANGVYCVSADLKNKNSYDRFAYAISSNTNGLTVTPAKDETNGEVTYSTSGLTFYKYSDNYNSFKLGENLYSADNKTATISVAYTPAGVMAIKANDDGTLLKYQGTGYNLTNEDGTGTFTLDVNGTDYTLTAVTAADNFEGVGDEEVPYLIRNEQELLQLALAVNKAESSYKDKYFRLENDLDYSGLDASRFQPIGNEDYPFEGYFDGNGHTIKGITVNTNTHSNLKYIGIFGLIKYGKVSHLKVSNSTFSGSTESASSSYVGGIAGVVAGIKTNDIETASAIYDCIADESVIISGACAGGIVAELSTSENYSDEVNVEGCISAAKVYGKNCAGGVIGWINAKAQIRNCLYTRKKATEENDYCVKCDNEYKAYGIGNIRNPGYVNRDIYYTDQTLDKLNDYDWKAHTVTAAEGLTLEFANPSVYYPLTKIQGYTPNGMRYDGNLYISNSQTAKFKLMADGIISGEKATAETTESENPISYDVSNSSADIFSVTDGVYTLKTDATGHNYKITATVTIDWAGSGTESDPYIIDNITKMNLLSSRAAAGNEFGGKFFKVTAKLDYSSVAVTDGKNFTPIKRFSGTFDGNSFTIQGIRINTPEADIAGIFLSLNGGKVKNLTVKDCQITGNYYVGGIAGVMSSSIYYADPAAIENCYVDGDVTVNATYKKNANAGGVVGYLSTGVTYRVIGNVSKATVDAQGEGADATGGNAGGIAGNKIANTNGFIHDNLYLGTTSQIKGASTGAIFGKQESRYGTVNTNFFTDPAFATTQYESLAYAYANVTYGAKPTVDHGLVAHYEDNNLLKYNNTFYSRYQKGDANGDGYINITDYVTIVNKIHNTVSGNINNFAADANGDGFINITDAVKVVNTIHSGN